MECAVTDGIRVEVESFYVADQSEPEEARYVFGYRITISNGSDRVVRLLRRHWVITDDLEQVTEVYGDGVVGEQPVLQPGESHTYTSGSVMETSTGSMEGEYEMQGDDGKSFEVDIPRFTLTGPRTIH